jgi:hypothetical protein
MARPFTTRFSWLPDPPQPMTDPSACYASLLLLRNTTRHCPVSGFFAWEPGESVWFPEAGMHLITQDATFLDFQGTRFRFVLNQSSERSFVARVASEVTDWCPQPNPLPEHGPTSHHSADIVSQRAI